MTVRFWIRPKQTGVPAAQSAFDRDRLRDLAQDLVAARQGNLHSEYGEFMVFRFESVTAALSAAKQLQSAIQGFHNHPSAPAVSASISLSGDLRVSSGAGAASPPRGKVFEGLLELAKPAQVLITHGLYEDLQGFPGLEFRSFPARAGIYEYLWAKPEDLEALQSTNDFNVPAPVVQPIAVAETALPQSISDFGMKRKRKAEAARRLAQNALQPANSAKQSGSAPSWFRELPRSRKLQLAMAAGAAVLVVGWLAVYLYVATRPHDEVDPRLASSPMWSLPSQPAPPNAGMPAPNPSSTSPQPADQAPASDPSKPAKPAAARKKADREAKDRRDAPPEAVAANCTIAGHIPTYLRMAESSRARGEYKAAERQYREVLNCEPGNVEARDGLNKAQRAEQEHYGPAGP